ncbi:hypothetical protein [Halomarina pelagica]|uniref:hypothetical protein n=1 Tax=Halomarina pelagica TaxID=2961599 RepID=UPI0020C4F22F|nr:hypothetical protein [Halomarina sp. BND7]
MSSRTEDATRGTLLSGAGGRAGGLPVGKWARIAMREVVKEAIKDAVVEGIEEADRRAAADRAESRKRSKNARGRRRSASGEHDRRSGKGGLLLKSMLVVGLVALALGRRERLRSAATDARERIAGSTGPDGEDGDRGDRPGATGDDRADRRAGRDRSEHVEGEASGGVDEREPDEGGEADDDEADAESPEQEATD